MLSVNPVSNKQTKVPSFGQMAAKLPSRAIRSGYDAIEQWSLLRHPKYSAIFQEEEFCTQSQRVANRQLRLENYSFLDKLWSDSDKRQFIQHFRDVTGFPNLAAVTSKILEEFRRVLNVANDNLNYLRPYSFGSSRNVLMSGYDEFCSVGQRAALPGSDLDKGYAIVRGVSGDLKEQREFSDQIKGEIWDNIDNRIMSVNHIAAFPNIMTDKELEQSLRYFDNYAKSFVTPSNLNYYRYLRLQNGNPVAGSRFNITLSERLSDKSDRYDAKNLAYIVEAMRDGKKLDMVDYYMPEMYQLFENSEFCHCSNVTQSHVMQDLYDYSDITKKKLKARKQVESAFNSWSVSKQYELVKDVIRSMSGDSKNPEFKDLFHSPNDRLRLLINDILRGKVGCKFTETKYGENALLEFRDAESRAKYKDFNIYG